MKEKKTYNRKLDKSRYRKTTLVKASLGAAAMVGVGIAKHADDVGKVLMRGADDLGAVAVHSVDDVGMAAGHMDDIGSAVFRHTDEAGAALSRHAEETAAAAAATDAADHGVTLTGQIASRAAIEATQEAVKRTLYETREPTDAIE